MLKRDWCQQLWAKHCGTAIGWCFIWQTYLTIKYFTIKYHTIKCSFFEKRLLQTIFSQTLRHCSWVMFHMTKIYQITLSQKISQMTLSKKKISQTLWHCSWVMFDMTKIPQITFRTNKHFNVVVHTFFFHRKKKP